jgi:hypothetical protein
MVLDSAIDVSQDGSSLERDIIIGHEATCLAVNVSFEAAMLL